MTEEMNNLAIALEARGTILTSGSILRVVKILERLIRVDTSRVSVA